MSFLILPTAPDREACLLNEWAVVRGVLAEACEENDLAVSAYGVAVPAAFAVDRTVAVYVQTPYVVIGLAVGLYLLVGALERIEAAHPFRVAALVRHPPFSLDDAHTVECVGLVDVDRQILLLRVRLDDLDFDVVTLLEAERRCGLSDGLAGEQDALAFLDDTGFDADAGSSYQRDLAFELDQCPHG